MNRSVGATLVVAQNNATQNNATQNNATQNTDFSLVESQFSSLADKLRREREAQPAEPWQGKEATATAKAKRLKAVEDFWQFDRIYFGEELYSDGYSKPAPFHKEMVNNSGKPGVQIILGARKHGKTAIAKKYAVWRILTGLTTFGGTLSQTRDTSSNILYDIADLLALPKIQADFETNFIELNAHQFTVRANPRVRPDSRPHESRFTAFSEGVSVRGATRLFSRPQWILCDDLETRQSPMGRHHTEERIKIIREAYQSMARKGTLCILGNAFDERCALHILRKEHEQGILPAHWYVHIYPAWAHTENEHGYPMWKSRFPAKTETELRTMLGVAGEDEWQADFQMNPVPPDGFIFSRRELRPVAIPHNAKGVIYCDPNLAKKGKGDSTAIIALLYAPDTQEYIIADCICRSYSDSGKLLSDILRMKSRLREHIRGIAFDGHVTQESVWTNNIRNWCALNQEPFPRVHYRRYNTDELAKNCSSAWNDNQITVAETLPGNDDFKRTLLQIFAFSGKKSNRADDAPDALICAFEFLHENKLARRAGANTHPVAVRDFFTF
jgi:hypothetical protein